MTLEKEENKKDVQELIAREKTEARKIFADLFEVVKKRYENLPNEKVKQEFLAHTEDVLEGVIEISFLKNFSLQERRAVEIAAILHDLAKADPSPKEYADIPNYVLVNHHQMAAAEVPEILTDEYLEKVGTEKGSFEDLRRWVEKAILEHMGPHPGFMEKTLRKVNTDLRKKGFSEIHHPQAEGKISQALLAADMKALADAKGIQKILALRSSQDVFLEEDKRRQRGFLDQGIHLSLAEVRFLSAMESALQAEQMVRNLDDTDLSKWIEEVIEQDKKVVFQDPTSKEELRWEEVLRKIKS